MARYRFGLIVLLVFLVRLGVDDAGLAAQEVATRSQDRGEGQPKPDQDAAKRLEQYKRVAGQYTIERHSEPPVTLKLKAEPVLRWNSPLRTAYDGVVFVWTMNGRPEVAATFYRNIRNGAPFEQADRADLGDGALFAFVHATDPEVLLVIEARSVEGTPAWHYGLGRMSGFPLRVWHKDRLVWDVRSMNTSYSNVPAPEQPR